MFLFSGFKIPKRIYAFVREIGTYRICVVSVRSFSFRVSFRWGCYLFELCCFCDFRWSVLLNIYCILMYITKMKIWLRFSFREQRDGQHIKPTFCLNSHNEHFSGFASSAIDIKEQTKDKTNEYWKKTQSIGNIDWKWKRSWKYFTFFFLCLDHSF